MKNEPAGGHTTASTRRRGGAGSLLREGAPAVGSGLLAHFDR